MSTSLPPSGPPPSGPSFVSGVIAPPASPMEPAIVLLIAIFFSSVAYFLYGQWKKGVASLLLYVALIVVAIVTCGLGKILFFPAYVLILIDAFMQARNLRDGRSIREWTFFGQTA